MTKVALTSVTVLVLEMQRFSVSALTEIIGDEDRVIDMTHSTKIVTVVPSQTSVSPTTANRVVDAWS